KLSLRLATLISAGSQHLLTLAKRHVPLARLRRASLGVPLELFSPRPGVVDGPPRLVHVGTLTPVKDQATLLHAFARLRRDSPDTVLDIVGAGPLHPELERLAHVLGLTAAVRFRGDIDHAALPDVYRAASAFVLSSRHEAQGMVAVEAAACGVPVVGTCVGVIPELSRSTALTGDPDGLANAVATVLGGPTDNALDLVRTQFRLERCADGFRHLYAEMSAGR